MATATRIRARQAWADFLASRRASALLPPGGARSPITFNPPAVELGIRVWIAPGADLSADPLTWPWEEITPFVRFSSGVSTSTGRPDEAQQPQPGATTLTLDNTDMRFSRLNPTGPYYGRLTRNTPLRIDIDAGDGGSTVVSHYVNEWPRRWDQSGNDATVVITAGGIMRKLAQNGSKSALRRTLLALTAVAATAPCAWWALEDPAGTARAVNETSSGTAMTPSPLADGDVITFGDDGSTAGSSSCVTLEGQATLTGQVSTVATDWTVAYWYMVDPTSMAAGDGVSSVARQQISIGFETGIEVDLELIGGPYQAPDSTVAIQGSGFGVSGVTGDTPSNKLDGLWHFAALRLDVNGSVATGTIYNDTSIQHQNLTATGGTWGSIRSIRAGNVLNWVNPSPTRQSFCHVVVFPTALSDTLMAQLATSGGGYTGERAHIRAARICAEAGIPFYTAGARGAACGPQPVGNELDALRDAATADMGAIYEHGFGLGYLSRYDQYNRQPAITLDFATFDISTAPDPTDDDQQLVNKATVTRDGGGSATSEATTGPNGTGAGGPGVYEATPTLNLARDSQLPGAAYATVLNGTIEAERLPSLSLDMKSDSGRALIQPWQALQPFGELMQLNNPPDGGQPGPLFLVIEGAKQRFTPLEWDIEITAVPADQYNAFQIGGLGNWGRIGSRLVTLAADASSVDTSLSVAVGGPPCATGATSFDILVEGEQMTVTNITGGASPQTFTVTRSVNGVVKAQPMIGPDGGSVAVTLYRQGAFAL